MSPSLPLVVEPDDLVSQLGNDDLLIVDLCREENWQAHHIPGAVHVSPAEIVSGIQPATGKLPDAARLQAVMRRIGLTPGKHVVAYDDEGGGWAGRFIWTLDVIGHEASSLLNGGLIAWANEGHPVTSEITETAPSSIDINIDRRVIADKEDVLAALGTDTIVWDARSAEEHAGLKVVAARGGHIPGARNLDWLELMDRERNLRLRGDLDVLLEQRGIDISKPAITHCQTHHRSGLTYFVGKMMGMDIRAYHGSWSEWGNDPDTPIDNPAS